VVYVLPPDCSSYYSYYYCGGVYYQPQYEEDVVSYVVVDKPAGASEAPAGAIATPH
jgi:hypothetical protein